MTREIKKSSFLPPLRFVFMMWLFFSLDMILSFDLGFLGILPRETSGLIGILTAPLIHGSFNQIVSNTFPMVVLSVFLYFFYNSIANLDFIVCIPPPYMRHIWHYKKANVDMIKGALELFNWEQAFQNVVNKQVEIFNSTLLNIFQKN